ELAQSIIDASAQSATESDLLMNVTVVDAGSNLKAIPRIDGAWLGRIDHAKNNPRTAQYFDLEPAALRPVAQPGKPPHHVEFSNGGLITFPGGIPLQLEDGAVVGAIGVSGSTVDNDQAVAEAGARAFQEALTS